MPNPPLNRITAHIEPLLPTTTGAANTDADTVYLAFTISAVELYPNFDLATVPLAFGILNASLPVEVGTVYLQINFYGNVTPPDYDEAHYVDSGTVQLFFDFASDDCYSILTPHWHCDVVKRWNITLVSNRWTVVHVQNRWDTWAIGVPIDNPCPDPTFAEMGF